MMLLSLMIASEASFYGLRHALNHYWKRSEPRPNNPLSQAACALTTARMAIACEIAAE